MLKLKANAIKTLAKALAESKNKKISDSTVSFKSSEIVQLNRKLREAFGVRVASKNVPIPQLQDLKSINKKNNPTQKSKAEETPTTAQIKKRSFNFASQKPITKVAPITEKNIPAGGNLERQKLEAQKAAEEQKKREQEQRLAEERIKQEKIRAQKEQEEKQRQLALLEAQREKKIKEDLERQKLEAQKAAEEQKKREQEQRLAEELKAANNLQAVLRILLSKLREKKEKQEKELEALPTQKAPLEQKRRVLESKIAMIKNSELATVEEREREVEKKAATEKENLAKNTTPDQEKILKQKIWETEDKRKDIEKQRWAVEDRINKILAEAQNIDTEILNKENEFKSIKQAIADISGQEGLVRFAAEKNKSEEEILEIIKEKEILAPDIDIAAGKKNEAEKNLAQLSQKETSLGNHLNAIEEQEKQTTDPSEKRRVEQSRWQASSELKSIVKAKWEGQEKFKEAATKVKTLQEKIEKVNCKIDKIQSKITAAEIDLEKNGAPVGALRDTIRRLLEENNVKFNQNILENITQAKEEQKEDPKTSPSLETASQQKQAQNRPPAQRPAQETGGVKNAENQKPTPATGSEKTQIQEERAKTENKIAPKTSEMSEQTTNDILLKTEASNNKKSSEQNKPETPAQEHNDSVKNEPTQEAKRKQPDLMNSNEPSKTAAVYREQVESSPAKNIRTFPGEDLAKSKQPEQKTPPRELEQKIESKTAAVETAVQESRKIAESKPVGTASPENRWQQIKKTTIPTATNAAVPADYPQTTKSQPINKAGKNKFLARMLVIFAITGILGIALIIILSKNSDEQVVKNPDTTTNDVKTKPVDEIPDTDQTILATVSLIEIYTDDPSNIPNLISPYLRKKFDANGYYGLSIQNRTTGKKIGLKELFNIYKINTPSIFYNSIDNDCEFFIYANNGKNRIGFVAQAANSNLTETAMSGWEGSIAQDTDNFFRLIGRKTQVEPATLKFNNAGAADGSTYRLMNFLPAEDEFAISWAIYQQKYFIFATSNNSMSKIFSQLPK